MKNLISEIRNVFKSVLSEDVQADYVTEDFIKETAEKGNLDISKYDMNELIKGFKIELEHGKVNPETNVTDDDPVVTLKITLAHLNEIKDYNTRLLDMEKVAKKETEEDGSLNDYTVAAENDESGENLSEIAKSKKQQRLMGQAYAVKTGKLKTADLNPAFKDAIIKMSKSMKTKDLEDFASTKHKGLPEKVKKKSKGLKEDIDIECPCKKHKITIEKNDPLNSEDKMGLFKKFVYDCCNELGILEPMNLVLTTKRGGQIQSTASFNPDNNDVYVYTQGRHFVDVLRSCGHELKHWHQNLNGVLDDKSGEDGSPHENEAHIFAGLMIRRFGKKHPEIYE